MKGKDRENQMPRVIVNGILDQGKRVFLLRETTMVGNLTIVCMKREFPDFDDCTVVMQQNFHVSGKYTLRH